MKIPETPVIQVPSTWPTDLRVREYPAAGLLTVPAQAI
jgi:hypothetical protein